MANDLITQREIQLRGDGDAYIPVGYEWENKMVRQVRYGEETVSIARQELAELQEKASLSDSHRRTNTLFVLILAAALFFVCSLSIVVGHYMGFLS